MDTSNPNPNSCAVDIQALIDGVDKLELDSYAGRRERIDRDLQEEAKKSQGDGKGRQKAEVEEAIVAIEQAGRVQPLTKIITLASGATETVELAHSYRLIRNLLRIEQHPVYKKALATWEGDERLFASRVERKLVRSGELKEEIYRVVGYYSVFQGVLLTASSQSSYLHCLNVGLPIALSAFASAGTLVHICRKFQVISDLQETIHFENTSLKEVKSRVVALKEKGPEGFRFYDFLEDKERKSSFQPKFNLCGLKSWFLVPVAIFLFSVVFVIAHPLILCRPGPK